MAFGLWRCKTQTGAMGHDSGLLKLKLEPQATPVHLLDHDLASLLTACFWPAGDDGKSLCLTYQFSTQGLRAVRAKQLSTIGSLKRSQESRPGSRESSNRQRT